MTYGIFQASGLIRTVAASLHHSLSSTGYEPHLQTIAELTVMLDP